MPKAGHGWLSGAKGDSWFEVKSHTANKQITTADALPDVTDGEIVQKKYQWIIDRGCIDRMETANGQTTITISEYPVLYNHPYDAFDKNGFFVQNHIKCLTELGDWCYDQKSHTITMYFGADSPEKHDVPAACLDTLANLTNRGHLRFDDIAFTGASGDLVKLDVPIGSQGKCDHVSLNNCELSFAGRNGISVVPYQFSSFITDATDGAVTNCTIWSINNNGISVQENPNWTITGNSMHHIAMNEGMQQSGDGQGIAICAAGTDSVIQYNDISSIGYSGIYFVGSGTQISKNHIYQFCTLKGDGGGIYSYGGEERKVYAKPRVIDHNIVHDGPGNIEGVFLKESGNPYAPQCQGIYMDGNVTDVIITNNTSFRNATAGLWSGSNGGITAYGNTLADNHTTQLQIDDQKSHPTKLNFHDNLLFAFEREQFCFSASIPHKPRELTQTQYVASIGTLANNLYFRPIQEPDNLSTKGYIHCCDGGKGFDPDRSYIDYGVFNDYPAGGVVSTTWDSSPFLSLDRWQKNWGQDVGTKKTFRTVGSLSELRIEFNPTNATVTKPLPGVFEDARGAVYKDSITLQPYSSAVLMLKE